MDQVSENPVKNRNDSFNSLVVISGLLITLYLTANIMAVKLISVFGVTLFDAGTVTFPLAYMLGDVLTEVWGFRTARKVIWLTFFCNVLLVASTAIGLVLPAADYMGETTKAYSVIFTYVPRIVAASLIAFLGGELLNAWSLVKIKELTKGKHLWMRTIGSSAVGYVFDTVAFVLIAFAGVAPTKDLLTMIIAQYFMKLGLESLAATPLAYALIHWMRRRRAIEESL
jgi:queuosine precursor transporter